MGGGGGGSPQPTQQTVTQTNIPEYARPYVESMLGATQQQLFDVSGQGQITGVKPYTPYSADPTAYVAGFSPMQQQAFQGIAGLGVPSQYGAATGVTAEATQRALEAGYQPGFFESQYQAPGQYAPGQFSMLQAQAPELQQYQMGAPERVSSQVVGTPLMATAQTAYRPDLQTFQMGAPERVRTGTFTQPGIAGTYMSPYMQNVVDVQQREAQRASNIAAQAQRAQAVGAGAFGGTRQALVEAERQRNLASQLGDIQATGQQAAFQQAQQQYNQEQQARMQAAIANQQAGLTAGGQNLAAALGVQQLGAQTGLQTALANLSAAQQANVQNQAAQLQAQGMNAQQALQAALANQQAGITVGGQNLSALLGIQQLGAGQNLQAQLANQQALQAAQQAAEQSRQYGYGQGMTSAQLAAQYGLAGQQLGEQSRQYGAGYGLQGLGMGLQGANQLAGLGGQQLSAQQGILGLQQQYGAMQQAQQQNIINQAIQNYAAAQQYPQQQLAFMNAMLRGLPLQTATTQTYQAAPSATSQLANLGIGAYGLSKAGVFGKKGGLTQDFEQKYAAGGITKLSRDVLLNPDKFSENSIKQMIAENVIDETVGLPALRTIELEKQKQLAAQAIGAPQQPSVKDQIMAQAGIDQAEIPETMFAGAGGGIVAFKSGGDDGEEVDDEEDDLEVSAAPTANISNWDFSQGIGMLPEEVSGAPLAKRQNLEDYFIRRYKNLLPSKERQALGQYYTTDLSPEKIQAWKDKQSGLGLAGAAFGAAAKAQPSTGNILRDLVGGLAATGQAYAPAMAEVEKQAEARTLAGLKGRAELEKTESSEIESALKAADKALESEQTRESREAIAKMRRESMEKIARERNTDFQRKWALYVADAQKRGVEPNIKEFQRTFPETRAGGFLATIIKNDATGDPASWFSRADRMAKLDALEGENRDAALWALNPKNKDDPRAKAIIDRLGI